MSATAAPVVDAAALRAAGEKERRERGMTRKQAEAAGIPGCKARGPRGVKSKHGTRRDDSGQKFARTSPVDAGEMLRKEAVYQRERAISFRSEAKAAHAVAVWHSDRRATAEHALWQCSTELRHTQQDMDLLQRKHTKMLHQRDEIFEQGSKIFRIAGTVTAIYPPRLTLTLSGLNLGRSPLHRECSPDSARSIFNGPSY